MILQNLVFPAIETCTTEELYFRKKGFVEYTWNEKTVLLHKNAVFGLDTYFNGFSVGKWKKYTKIENVFFALRFQGKIRILLIWEERVGREAVKHYRQEIMAESDGDEVALQFKDMPVTGMLAVEIAAITDTRLYGGYYGTKLAENEIRPVKLALEICTYKREEYVVRNLFLLQKELLSKKAWQDRLEVFVIDNGGTLEEKGIDRSHIHFFRNKNVGGAGGFTRGLMEIKGQQDEKGFTHALLMDDDIVIEPEAIVRTWTLLSVLKEEYWKAFVGGGMLRLDKPYIQVESGALWNRGDLVSRKAGLDLRNAEACLYNEIEETVDYNAWWYCVIPLEVVTEENLPLPIFIRGDDVEYGLRNADHIILMNGICVWHEPFENKYSSALFYYILRNRLIDNAIHGIALSQKEFLRQMKHQVLVELYLYRYKNVLLLLQGVEDYYKGIDWLKEQDGEELHRQVLENGYKMQDIVKNRAFFDYAVYEQSFAEPEKKSMIHRFIRKVSVNGIYLCPKRSVNVIPVVNGRHISTWRTSLITHYDAASQKCFVTYRDRKETQKCLRQLKKMTAMTRKRYVAVNEQYRARGSELMNREFWNQYLGL